MAPARAPAALDYDALAAAPHEDGTAAPAGDAGWAPRAGQERLELAIAYLDLGSPSSGRVGFGAV